MPSYKRYQYKHFIRRPDHPNYNRRSVRHDYHRPARYMITIMNAASTPSLSYISGDSKKGAAVNLTPVGSCFEEALAIWSENHPQIRVSDYVVMPDHVHLCLWVTEYLKKGLGLSIAALMGKATSIMRDKILGEGALSSALEIVDADNIQEKGEFRFFGKGFNDRIAYDGEQWERQIAYVKDNPRRYLIKKMYPEYFRMRWVISVAGREYQAMGNIFLLKEPEVHVVRFSRRFADGEFERRVALWREAILNGGVLISPFIHPKEKDVRDYAIEEGGGIIRVCENGFAERYAPQGEEFELMSAERLLLIGPMEYRTQREDLTYNRAQELNRLSEEIAAIDWAREEARIRLLR